MKKSILKFVGCLLAGSCLFPLATTAESQDQNSTPASQPHYKPKQKTNHTVLSKSPILVPPPPPTQPSLLDWSGFGDIPDSLSYLNVNELNVKLENVRKRINHAKLKAQGNDAHLAESKEKALRFESLYTEGVISRKELESVHNETDDMQTLIDEDKSNVSDLEIQEAAIVRQLNLRMHKKNNTKHRMQSIKQKE
jgi:hypothetical protein